MLYIATWQTTQRPTCMIHKIFTVSNHSLIQFRKSVFGAWARADTRNVVILLHFIASILVATLVTGFPPAWCVPHA